MRGKKCPRPIKKWTQCGLSDRLLAVIEKRAYSKPFPIQAQALPAIMNGRDVIAVAKTGSGKTMGYCLPMLRHIMDQPPLENGEGPIGLILVPTRELAMQVFREVSQFTKTVGLNAIAVYGGANLKQQIAELKRCPEIVVRHTTSTSKAVERCPETALHRPMLRLRRCSVTGGGGVSVVPCFGIPWRLMACSLLHGSGVHSWTYDRYAHDERWPCDQHGSCNVRGAGRG